MLNLVPLAGEQVSDLEIKPLNLNLKSKSLFIYYIAGQNQDQQSVVRVQF